MPIPRRSLLGLLGALPTRPSPFLAEPYLNVSGTPNELTLLFHANPAPYQVRTGTQRVIPASDGHVHVARLTNLTPNQPFPYQIFRDGQPIFHATAKPPGRSYRMVLFGDSGRDTPALRTIAAQAAAQNPDVFLHLGDIAYEHGRTIEYRATFFPIYPFLRTRPTFAVPGNHDIDRDDCGNYADAYAYYRYWRQPRNGPGNNFSFEIGDTHWTVLDSNRHADLRSPDLHRWLDADLRSTAAKWRLIAVHHPPFSSGLHHATETQTRALVPVFQKNNVDAVFSGHDHNYQRTRPLLLNGGRIEINPKGIPYIISGAGGTYLADGADNPQPYSYIAHNMHSLSVLDVTSSALHFRQIDSGGRELDAFRILK